VLSSEWKILQVLHAVLMHFLSFMTVLCGLEHQIRGACKHSRFTYSGNAQLLIPVLALRQVSCLCSNIVNYVNDLTQLGKLVLILFLGVVFGLRGFFVCLF